MKQLVNLFRNARKKSKTSRLERKRVHRRLQSESLEKRELLAGDLLAGHNYAIAADVNGDYKVSVLDALLVINQLGRNGGPQNLSGVASSSLTNYYDVNGDNQISALDALRVLNAMRNPEGAGELAEFQIQPRKLDKSAFSSTDFNQATRTLTVGVGDVFNLELDYQDLRGSSGTGLFSVSSNFVTSIPNALEPILDEAQTVQLSGAIRNVASGDVRISMPGKTPVDVPLVNFQSSGQQLNAISDALGTFGYTPSQFIITDISPTDPVAAATDPTVSVIRRFQVHFVDLALAYQDIPNLSLTAVSPKDSTGAAVAIASTSSQINPRNADGTINPNAPLIIDFRSRNVNNALYYYDDAPDLFRGSFDSATGFNGIYAVGKLNPAGVPRFSNPFDALSIPVRVVKPTPPGALTGLRVTLTPTTDPDTPVTLYGNDNPVPSTMLLYNTTNDDTDATDGKAILNIVAVGQQVTVAAADSTLNFTEDGAAQSIDLTTLTTVSSGTPVFTISTPPAAGRGTAVIVGNNLTYTPAADDFTTTPLTFVYTATVGTASDTGTITVNIAGVNDPPIFTADGVVNVIRAVATTIAGSTLVANDKPGPTNESGTVTISAVSPTTTQGGTVTLNGQNIVYTSAAGFTGTDTITYTISDGSATNGTATATLTLNVTPTNAVNVAANDSTLTFVEDGAPQTIDLSALTTVTGSATAATFTILTSPARGTLSAISGTSVTYTPAADDFTTTALTFVYNAAVGTNSDTGTITINISPVNDAPIFVADTAVAATRGVALTIVGSTLLANDRPGPTNETGTVTITAVISPTTNGGTVALSGQNIIYTSAVGFTGTDTISYTISDGAIFNSTTQASLTVNVTAPASVTVAANDSTLAFAEDGAAKTINLSSITVVGGSSAVPNFVIVTSPARGTLSAVSGTSVTYTPAADDFTTTPLTFVYSATVGSVSDTGTVTITISAVNDPPVFVADTALSTTRGVALTIATSTLLANDRPGPANETGTVTLATTPTPTATSGTVAVSGSNLVFTPAANFTGTAVISYSISDGSLTAPATLSVTVVAPNVVTVAAGDSTLNFTEDGAAQTLNLSTLTTVTNSTATPAFSITTSPARGTLSILGSTITYTPAADDFTTTPLTFVYRATVGTVSDTGTVSINISSVNDAPVATADTVFALVSVPTTFVPSVLLVNDRPGPANESSQTLTLTAVAAITGNNATKGTVTLAANGNVIYQPPTGFEGSDQFSYTISDGTLTTSGTVTVNVANFQPSSISGQIFMDFIQTLNSTTRDKIRQSNEPAMSGLQVKLSSAGKADVFAYTDVNGDYKFKVNSPGTYQVTFSVPDTLIAGGSSPGALASALSGNSLQVVVGQLGGVNATSNNFTILAAQGVAAVPGIGSSPLDILVNPYDNSALTGEAIAILDAAGNQQFFDLTTLGYENVKYAELALNAAHDEALLTILQNGVVKSLLLDHTQFLLSGGDRVVKVFGAANSFAVATATPAQLAAEFGSYRDSVDAVLASL